MAENLTFGFREVQARGSRRKHQLTVSASSEIFADAKRFSPDLSDGVDMLSGRSESGYGVIEILDTDEDGLAFAVRAGAIGRANNSDKTRYLVAINSVIGALVAAGQADYADGTIPPGVVHLSAYFPSAKLATNDFAIAGMLRLPAEIEGEKLANVAVGKMRSVARAICFFGVSAVRITTEMICADVSRRRGVMLAQSINSSIHTLGEEFQPGDQVVGLSGNNVMGPHEPLIYLVGMTALAKADQFAV